MQGERGERGVRGCQSRKNDFPQACGKCRGIFKNLPKPLEWRSFFTHDLNLLVDSCIEVQGAAIQHDLNRSQTRVLAKLNAVLQSEFQGVVNPRPSSNRKLSDFSATEIEAIADKEVRKRPLAEQAASRPIPAPIPEVKILVQARLGISAEGLPKG